MAYKMDVQVVALSQMELPEEDVRKKLEPGDFMYERLEASLEHFGDVRPIIWDEATGIVVDGRQKVRLLMARGEKEAKAVVVNLSQVEADALRIAVNQISGQWDEDNLSIVMRRLEEAALSDLTGFSDKEIEKMLSGIQKDIQQMGEIDTGDFAEEAFSHQCPKCGYRFND